MLFDFASVLVFMTVGVGFVLVSLLFSRLIHPVHRTYLKLTNYECGEVAEGSPWVRFNIRFYRVALAFIIFDVETVFLFPWAVVYGKLGLFAFIEMAIFVLILLVGLAYLWVKGDLEWVKPRPLYSNSSAEQRA
ncbi:MAG: NADH-quinone oxidoreductase subunit A [Candidatus Eiseniibacteriota bacterium]